MPPPPVPKPSGSAYFEKKGEVYELRQLLRSAAQDRDQQKKRDAIKKVIAYMTLGIDVSPLFSEMIMASATADLVQKKMVYLYLVNYAESNSELAILAVNTLQKDCRDDDPMVRGLALRSLCSLNLLNMVEYLQPAVLRALGDFNGYVRKTAAIGVVKLFHISNAAVLDSDIFPALKRLIQDNDAHVVANAIHAIDEILAEDGGLQPTREMLTNLLNRLGHFSEWGQCAVLRLLTKYHVTDEAEMFDIMNVLDALLKQSSSVVVLAVTKIFMDLTCNRVDLQQEVLRRLKGPLLTLMAAHTPELAYTVLVHIHALCTRGNPCVETFASEFKQFFCRYNEPSYIKTVKIDILTLLTDATSAEQIVSELSEYVTDVDAEISRRAVSAIGKIAVRVPSSSELIVSTLTGLLELDIDYVSTEAAVVMKDLVRKYPEQFQRASGAVERCTKIVSEPMGKCAVLWILGEYGLLIEDAPYTLEPMIEGFLEETDGSVRLEMLTAAVKLFFCRPAEMQGMLGLLLQKAIEVTTHPDVRDRALLYYRLLQVSVAEARRVICAPKEVVEEFQEEMDVEMKDRIFDEFNTFSIVYKLPASKFVVSKNSATFTPVKMQPPPVTSFPASMDTDGATSVGPVSGNTDVMDGFMDTVVPQPAPTPQASSQIGSDDLLGEAIGEATAAALPHPSNVAAPAVADDLLGMGDLWGGDTIVSSPSSEATPAFSLVMQTSMDGASFQGRWKRLQETAPHRRSMRPMVSAPMTTAAIEGTLRQVGIHVIASGTVPPGNVMKFFFYAQQATPTPSNVWFMFELLVTPGASIQVSLKAENAQHALVESFLSLLWQALGDYVA
eukprot:TRINITY_DN2365_c0_g2_i1.p1 TRINITY_DN2365_c0_g2~~TRINITY_DN2365_c0_g2_i1.p1  ORF type:complete len:839 (+),score=169.68 TRINITY_DN2365_c0_g2_i1:145-2661(+)